MFRKWAGSRRRRQPKYGYGRLIRYDGNAMAQSFELLDERLEFEPVEPFLRTHPKLQSRIATAKNSWPPKTLRIHGSLPRKITLRTSLPSFARNASSNGMRHPPRRCLIARHLESGYPLDLSVSIDAVTPGSQREPRP
jgi:hypothetical protein